MKILVILGNKLNQDSTLSSVGLLRVSAGFKIHNFIDFDKIILSGGVTNGYKKSEARAMSDYLVKNGVSEELLILEENSRNTMENGKYTVDILNGIEGSHEIFVLSSKGHIARRFHNPVEVFDAYAHGNKNLHLVYVGV
ncbi:MAG: YdcF family protein [Bacillota bacterium]